MSGIYINVDFCNQSLNFDPDSGKTPYPPMPMNEEGLRQEIDYYAVKGVSAILFNLNAMRAMFDSHTIDPIWKGLEKRGEKYFFRGKELGSIGKHKIASVVVPYLELYRNVPDPQRLRYDYCHQKGVNMGISMRMNDVHWTFEEDLITHADFWREHPEYRRAAYKKEYAFLFPQCFDYARQEVFEYQMALVREYLERFEMDCFELDWMRSPYFFRPGETEKGRAVLTKFMEEVRTHVTRAEKKWGHKIKIITRVHSWPEECLETGLDVFAWAKKGLVDVVVPSPYYSSNDPSTPVEIWKMLLPDSVELSPCMDCKYSGIRCNTPSVEALDAGLASSFYYRGADSIYLFNHMFRHGPYGADRRDSQKKYYTILADPESVQSVERRCAAAIHEGKVEGEQVLLPFPPEIPAKNCVTVRIYAGDGTKGRKARIYLASEQGTLPAGLEVRLNTQICKFLPDCPPYPDYTVIYLTDDVYQYPGKFFFEIPEGTLHGGLNMIDLINKEDKPFPLSWVEINISAE